MARKVIQPKPGLIVGTLSPEDQARVNVVFQPIPNQQKVLSCPATEILAGGNRGGSKTVAGILFMINGNQAFHEPRPGNMTDISYVYNPHYRGLVVRENYKDMKDWIDRAIEIYAHVGGRWFASEQFFQFIFDPPYKHLSGAKIFVGHVADDKAWQKYQGHEYQRINCEELPQIPDQKTYTLLMSSLRTPFPDEMYPQIYGSANPIGRGVTWVKNRWVKVKDKNGNIIPPETIFYERRGSDGRLLENKIVENNDPKEVMRLRREEGILTRCYIPMPLKDNPYLMKDKSYIAMLMALPDAERRALLDGDWDAMVEGRYFESFREKPLTGEPDYAYHVTPPVYLAPHWERWGGGDFGYAHESAFYWACNNRQDGRIHVYRELVTSQVTYEMLGMAVAEATLPDLLDNPESPTMTFYISPDAFDKNQGDAAPSLAEQFAEGIEKVLGKGGAFLPYFADEEKLRKFYADASLDTPRIVLQKASNARIAGWQYMQKLFRWHSVLDDEMKPVLDVDYAYKLMKEAANPEAGKRAVEQYMRKLEAHTGEVLPKVRIWTPHCKKVIAQLQELVRDPKNLEDVDKNHGRNDRADGLRYCLYSHSLAASDSLPRDKWESEWMERHWGGRDLTPRQRYFAEAKMQRDWREREMRSGGVITLPNRRGYRAEIEFLQ